MKRKDNVIPFVRPSATRELRDDASDRDLLLYVLRRSEERQERHEAAMRRLQEERQERHEAAMRLQEERHKAAMRLQEEHAARVREQLATMRIMGESLQRERDDSHARFLEARSNAKRRRLRGVR